MRFARPGLTALGVIAVLGGTAATAMWPESGIDARFLVFATLTLAGPAAVGLLAAARATGPALRAAALGFAGITSLLFGIVQWRSLDLARSIAADPELAGVAEAPSPLQLGGASAVVLAGVAAMAGVAWEAWRSPGLARVLLAGLAGAVVGTVWRYVVPLLAFPFTGNGAE